MLYKAIRDSVKDVDTSKGVIKAYFSAFGNKDSDGDIIHAGAFSKTITERGPSGSNRIKHMKNHDLRNVPGKLLELGEDEKGGFFVSKLASTTLGKDTLIEYQEGIITEHSHGFEIIEEKEEEGTNHITESKLWEVSSLTAWGANPNTPVDWVKGIASPEEAVKILERLNKYLKEGSFSDELLKKIEIQVVQITEKISTQPHSTEPPNQPSELLETFKSSLTLN